MGWIHIEVGEVNRTADGLMMRAMGKGPIKQGLSFLGVSLYVFGGQTDLLTDLVGLVLVCSAEQGHFSLSPDTSAPAEILLN